MLNTYCSKLLKLSCAVLLVMVFTIGFTKNISYAVTYEEFYTIMENNVGNSNINISNWWNGLKGQDTTISLMQSNWQSNNSIAVYGYYNTTYGWQGMVYFIYNNGNTYRHNAGIQWTVGRNGYLGYNFTKSSFGLTNNGANRSNFVPSNADIINHGAIFNNSNTDWIFITDSDIYADNTITDLTTDTWYFKTYSLTSTNFEKINTGLDYSNTYTTIGKITGENLNTWRVSAIFYKDYDIIAEKNIPLHEDKNMIITRNPYNLNDDDIYIGVLTSLLYENKNYYIHVFYEEDESQLTWEESYTFVIGSGDSSYTSQNSTNDIIQNQNNNTQEVINAITESGDISGEISNFFNNLSGDFANIFGYNDFSGDEFKDFNNIANAVTTLYSNIQQSLMTSGDVVYTFPYMKTTITLHSNDFITPNGALKTFVSSFLVFGTVALFYKYLLHIFHKAKEGSVKGVSSSIEVDDESLLM